MGVSKRIERLNEAVRKEAAPEWEVWNGEPQGNLLIKYFRDEASAKAFLQKLKARGYDKAVLTHPDGKQEAVHREYYTEDQVGRAVEQELSKGVSLNAALKTVSEEMGDPISLIKRKWMSYQAENEEERVHKESGMDAAIDKVGEYQKKAQVVAQGAAKKGDKQLADEMTDAQRDLQRIVQQLDELDADVHDGEQKAGLTVTEAAEDEEEPVTKDDFDDYVELQASGKMNMYAAAMFLGKHTVKDIMKNYDKYAKQWPDVLKKHGLKEFSPGMDAPSPKDPLERKAAMVMKAATSDQHAVFADMESGDERSFLNMVREPVSAQSIDKALEVVVNNVEGDWSQLPRKLYQYAKRKGWTKGFESVSKRIEKLQERVHKESVADDIMRITGYLVDEHNVRSGKDFLKDPLRSEFKKAVKHLVPKITKQDLLQLEDENFHSELEILLDDFGLMKVWNKKEAKDLGAGKPGETPAKTFKRLNDEYHDMVTGKHKKNEGVSKRVERLHESVHREQYADKYDAIAAGKRLKAQGKSDEEIEQHMLSVFKDVRDVEFIMTHLESVRRESNTQFPSKVDTTCANCRKPIPKGSTAYFWYSGDQDNVVCPSCAAKLKHDETAWAGINVKEGAFKEKHATCDYCGADLGDAPVGDFCDEECEAKFKKHGAKESFKELGDAKKPTISKEEAKKRVLAALQSASVSKSQDKRIAWELTTAHKDAGMVEANLFWEPSNVEIRWVLWVKDWIAASGQVAIPFANYKGGGVPPKADEALKLMRGVVERSVKNGAFEATLSERVSARIEKLKERMVGQ
jgi:hypothetical protein